jgi:hypothetical protein
MPPPGKRNNKRKRNAPKSSFSVAPTGKSDGKSVKKVKKFDSLDQFNGQFDELEDYEYAPAEIESDEDEEIDDDEAFNDSDEEKYGEFFRVR